MKEVMTKMYEALDGTLFTSPSAAKQHEANLILAGARPTEAQVTRKVAKLYALHLMEAGGRAIEGKTRDHFGKCEIELLLDLIYGHRRDGRPVDVNAMIGEINFLLESKMSEYFKLPPYNDDQPLVEHPFYQWLTDNVDRSQGGHSKMLDWIKGLGFRVGEDALAPEDVDTLHFVEEHWWRCSPWFNPCSGKDLFVKPTAGGESFYFGGPHFSEFRGITQKLRDMVMAAGWIYNVHPSTTYFEVIGGRLCAKYQQILGSRYICDISDYKEQQP